VENGGKAARGCHGRNPPRPGEVAGGDGSSALRIDVMINNAGLMPRAPLERLEVDEWDHMIDEVCSEAYA
jgi:NAD(P)-dependent dehydrogenase (short-subunit alcohol dehydrogenase family)